ncbi:hypothetical protein Poli38472_005962 [Pythium oligandrum]|uniref:Uncharacterized protein n=1 Tax=Pythium oligandrum TaxID=41045 RepID=A0A8K1CSM6_PYTOL|nr:hypothetical protein Poli38472_005962 [Pythium oligandrum]|eukprot:TMW68494.1 hypothetical protein Poli38472_005962 [Pythium oligandrum]
MATVMEPEQIQQYKEEYYETLEENKSLHEMLNQHGGLVLARVGSHPPWPARVSEPGEFVKMVRHRQKKGQICVYFFGTRNYGWASTSAIAPFSNDLSSLKTSKKYSPTMIQKATEALAEAQLVLDDTDEHNMRFYDSIMERRHRSMDMPCEYCNRVDDHYSLLILCDGKDCGREFHMGCLKPPMLKVPPGDWYCPECSKDSSKIKGGEQQKVSPGESSTKVASNEGSGSAAGDSAKKPKKERLKVKEGSLKRKLPPTSREKGKPESDTSPALPKKNRQEFIEESDVVPSKSPRKGIVKKQLWKCSTCPLALAEGAVPSLPKNQISSKINKLFTCAHCSSGAPAKVQLARALERIWSVVATNRQAMPFCNPLLPGIDPPKDMEGSTNVNLFRILAKIRRLEYEDVVSFTEDIEEVVQIALGIIGDQSQPLLESATTLQIMCEEQVGIHKIKLEALENKVSQMKELNKPKRLLEEAYVSAPGGEKKKWPVRWRGECGSFDDKFYPAVESRSITEWTAFVTAAPLYTSCEDLEEMSPVEWSQTAFTDHGVDRSSTVGNRWSHQSDADDGAMNGRTRPAPVPSFPGLTLSEGTDVMIALSELSQRKGDDAVRCGGWLERERDDVDGRDFFLSPSISEMQQMFDQQSALLRRALESHSALQRAWLVSKQKLLGLGDGVGFSVGEGRLAAELRLANKNLRARLQNKDKLVDQLTSEHARLRTRVQALEHELSEMKGNTSGLEKSILNELNSAQDDIEPYDTVDDSGVSSSEGTPNRKSPRAPAKETSTGKGSKKVSQKAPKKPIARTK